MSIKSYFQVVDAPLAIVVGGVGAVLIALQLGAVGWLAQSQVDRAHEREAGARQVRMEQARCLGVSGVDAFAACKQSSVNVSPMVVSRSYDGAAETIALR
ncbi:hypothetical protein GN316_16460 [Xylophilus sp. Kf1]|nr:hypothetical protein [Xylophilus sp. Kf1]